MVLDGQPALNPAQYHMLTELVKETRGFLADYDSLVLHKELYRCLFLYTLSNLRGKVVKLLLRFSTLPKENFDEKEVECCGLTFKKNEDFQDHYEQAHNKRTLQSASLCELKMSLTKITFFERRIRGYLAAGEISSCEMILNLKKILRKIDATLDF